MGKKINVWIFIMAFLLAQPAYAEIELEINSSKLIYEPNDIIELEILINNTYLETKELVLLANLIYQYNVPNSEIDSFYMILEPGELKLLRYLLFVEDSMPKGIYTLQTEILDDERVVKQASYKFSIENTSKTFEDIYFTFCFDNECSESLPPSLSSFVVEDSPIYLKAFETLQAALTGILILPDKSSINLMFWNNTAEISLIQKGNYSVEIKVSKEGYQDFSSYIEFEVVDSAPNIIDLTHVCNLNGICGRDESYQNCPQDCEPGELPLGLRKIILEIEKWAQEKEGALELVEILAMINAWRESYSV